MTNTGDQFVAERCALCPNPAVITITYGSPVWGWNGACPEHADTMLDAQASA